MPRFALFLQVTLNDRQTEINQKPNYCTWSQGWWIFHQKTIPTFTQCNFASSPKKAEIKSRHEPPKDFARNGKKTSMNLELNFALSNCFRLMQILQWLAMFAWWLQWRLQVQTSVVAWGFATRPPTQSSAGCPHQARHSHLRTPRVDEASPSTSRDVIVSISIVKQISQMKSPISPISFCFADGKSEFFLAVTLLTRESTSGSVMLMHLVSLSIASCSSTWFVFIAFGSWSERVVVFAESLDSVAVRYHEVLDDCGRSSFTVIVHVSSFEWP